MALSSTQRKSSKTEERDASWALYRANMTRHLLDVSRQMQTRMMNTLQLELGHQHLRLGFAPYITLCGGAGMRLSALAETLGITRQACNQAVTQIEKAGYLQRTADPLDGRAKQVTLTQRGEQLRNDGARVLRNLDKEFAAIAGSEAVSRAARALGKLHTALALGANGNEPPPFLYGGLGGPLPRLSDYTLQRLMNLTQARGHPGLKLSFGQVLLHVGPKGGRIQEMAAIHDVSKQAISAIATELEELGYLRREADPQDARQLLLFFTPKGEALITDSVASVETLQQEFADIIGTPALLQASEVLEKLHRGLGLSGERRSHPDSTDLLLLAAQLRERLGDDGARTLGKLLLEPAPKQT